MAEISVLYSHFWKVSPETRLITYMTFSLSLGDSVGNLVRKFNKLLVCVKLLTRFHAYCLAVIMGHTKCWRILYITEREKIVCVIRTNKMYTFYIDVLI
jgi:hypothetical protein